MSVFKYGVLIDPMILCEVLVQDNIGVMRKIVASIFYVVVCPFYMAQLHYDSNSL